MSKEQVFNVFEQFCNFVGFEATVLRRAKEELFLLSSLTKDWDKAYSKYHHERVPQRYITLVNEFVGKQKKSDLVSTAFDIIDEHNPLMNEISQESVFDLLENNKHGKAVFKAAFEDNFDPKSILKLAIACHEGECFEDNIKKTRVHLNHELKMALKHMQRSNSFLNSNMNQTQLILEVFNRNLA